MTRVDVKESVLRAGALTPRRNDRVSGRTSFCAHSAREKFIPAWRECSSFMSQLEAGRQVFDR
jgi:hypothetical protein